MRAHTVEAYLDVEEHNRTDGYGFKTGTVPAFHDCNRRGYEKEDINEALAAAIVSSLKEWEEPLRQAELFTLQVQSKYGPPYWTLKVNNRP